MSNLINTTGIYAPQFISGRKGSYRVITKSRAGFLTVTDLPESESLNQNPGSILARHTKGALQSIEFRPEGVNHYLTVFAKVGKKIKVADEDILKTLTVGIINQGWYNTELYSQHQYSAVQATSWASKAYVMNDAIDEEADPQPSKLQVVATTYQVSED